MRTLTRAVVLAVAAHPATLETAVVTAAVMAPAAVVAVAVAAVAVVVAARAWHCTAAAVSWCLFAQKAEDGAQRSGVVPNDNVLSFCFQPRVPPSPTTSIGRQ
jgi:hypothetical protein